jgi:hemopexin
LIIDTAISGQGDYEGKAFFFKDSQYVRYDWNSEQVDAGYPADLSAG